MHALNRIGWVAAVALLSLSSVAVAEHNAMARPPVRVAVADGKMLLTFPEHTLGYTVGFRAHGFAVTQRLIRRHKKAIAWTSPTELSVDLVHFHEKGMETRPTELWVWGQLKTGEALIQKHTIP